MWLCAGWAGAGQGEGPFAERPLACQQLVLAGFGASLGRWTPWGPPHIPNGAKNELGKVDPYGTTPLWRDASAIAAANSCREVTPTDG